MINKYHKTGDRTERCIFREKNTMSVSEPPPPPLQKKWGECHFCMAYNNFFKKVYFDTAENFIIFRQEVKVWLYHDWLLKYLVIKLYKSI